MSLMKAKNQLVHIPLYYMEKEVKGYTKIIVLTDEKAKEILKEQEEAKKKKTKKEVKDVETIVENTKENIEEQEVETAPVECLNTYWKSITWKEQNQITKMSQIPATAENTLIDIDYFRLRDLRIKMCLKKWDLKDEDGKEVAVTPDNLDSLPADVVYALIAKYDSFVTLTEDEAKN